MGRPNIVLVIADDMGYGDFSAFNYGASHTPVLDELMAEGVCLSQHYSASPICAPARAALQTGRYPHRTGAIDTVEICGLDRMSVRETTVADLLKRAGYTTGLIGKWHNGAVEPRYHPNARGYDEFVGFRGGWWDYYDWTLDCNGSFRQADGRYLTDVFTTEAVEFIARHKDGPFYLNVAYNAPHEPFQAPAEDIKVFLETGSFNTAVSTVYGMIRRMDQGVGQILEALRAHGLAENTIVLFTSDNGPQFGHPSQGDRDTTRFNCGFRGSKGKVWEGGIRVPMIVRWPGRLDGGRCFHEMVHFVDWLPTLLAMAGAEPPAGLGLDGDNVLPVLRGQPGKVNPRRFWQWNRYVPVGCCNAAMRDGDWKLVRPIIGGLCTRDPEFSKIDVEVTRNPEKYIDRELPSLPLPVYDVPSPLPPAELYNIAADPLETRNLADAHPNRAARMLGELESWFESVEADRAAIED